MYFKSRRKIFGLAAAFVCGGCGIMRVFVFWVRPAARSFVSRVCKRAQDDNEKSLKRSSKQQEVIILQMNRISDYFLKAAARFVVLRRLFACI